MPSGEMAAPEDLESFESVNVFVKKFETTSLVAVDQSNDDPKISAETAIYRYHFVDRECRAVSTSPGLVTRCPGSNPVTAECDRLPAILLLYIISLLHILGRHSTVAVSGAT